MAIGLSGSNGGIGPAICRVRPEEMTQTKEGNAMALGFSGSNGGIAMAVGFSGSNGGVAEAPDRVQLNEVTRGFYDRFPKELSFFVNNVCNLSCQHCYVNYERRDGDLSVDEWKGVFGELIALGARTFGNVGMEPLLSWEKSRELMLFLAERRKEIPELRFGMVTNGTLLDGQIAGELAAVAPDYLDVSVDGDKISHDAIRGSGMFQKTVGNLKLLPDNLKKKVFISFTLNRVTASRMEAMIVQLSALGFCNFLVSPYATVLDRQNDRLWMPAVEMARCVQDMVERLNVPGVSVLVKSDYDTSSDFMDALTNIGLIDLENLFVDKYGVVFCLHEKRDQKFFFNWLGMPTTFIKDIRISHDGFVSGCQEMFFKGYQTRAKGNVRDVGGIGKILAGYRSVAV